jgi:hypothetical protein
VHEIVWKPTPKGLTAEFRFVPLWFFENRLGRLRYLPQEGAIDGIDLEPENWMVTVGDGLMLPCAIAYMFKHLPLKDWLVYCERFGMPIPIGETAAPKDSPEWAAMVAAVESIMAGAAAVKNTGENITLLETKGVGELPHPVLVERMDRAMSAMWRGSDLSTMSRGGKGQAQSVGASVQGDESEILELDDTETISETLNIQVSRSVIRYAHGDDEPLAYIKVQTTRRVDVQNEILVDEFLCSNGFPLDLQSVSERYGRPIPEGVKPTDLLKPSAPTAGSGVRNPEGGKVPSMTENEALANKRTPPEILSGQWITIHGRHVFVADGDTRPIDEIIKAGKDPATMTAGEINKELDALRDRSSDLTDRFIAAGRGHELPTETHEKTDPLALERKQIGRRFDALRDEKERRYGPGSPSHLPSDFGPRKKHPPRPAVSNEQNIQIANALLSAAKKKMRSDAAQILGQARKHDLSLIAVRLNSIFALPDSEQANHLKTLRSELPAIATSSMRAPHGARLLADLMSAEFFNGIDDAAKQREAA